MPARELDSGSCSPSIPSVSQSKSCFINPYPDFKAALFMFGEFEVLGHQQSSGNPENERLKDRNQALQRP
ncbi:hypothetical protein L596_009227 [Steinernema carpocapsae]|uniref:Uncharacterized protein n=1 Tax=Steinernema carpocapsae TaxID=34508 RepID=A0A4U5PES4_STECR|nr:hypothetical protein L596_009227 [Steinernema carpocapsae]